MAKIICENCQVAVELECNMPFSSDACQYWACPNCRHIYDDEDEIQMLECEYDDALEEARTENEECSD